MQTIKEKTIYITTDGKEWSDRKQAKKWQNHLSYKNKEQNKAEFEKKYNELSLFMNYKLIMVNLLVSLTMIGNDWLIAT